MKLIATKTVSNLSRACRYFAKMVGDNPASADFAGALESALEAHANATMERFDADMAGLGEPKRQPTKAPKIELLFSEEDRAVIVAERAKRNEAWLASQSEVAVLESDDWAEEAGCADCRKAAKFATDRNLEVKPCRAHKGALA